jgi:uncharacterized protein YndB with AHSA1/START domain
VLIVHGQNGVEYGHAVRDAMASFTDRLRSSEWTGATGGRVKTVITNRPRWGGVAHHSMRCPSPSSHPATREERWGRLLARDA